uniref:Anti-proliferative protein domain-containing protein n=1 Tax=Setaria digitata TaxID=48799 RepID=A0A915PLT0_9BILA
MQIFVSQLGTSCSTRIIDCSFIRAGLATNMYTEIKELVNFLAVYMHHRIPRRRVMFTDGICLCMESYANHLATKFHDTWSIDEPKYAESERVVAVKTSNGLDDMFSAVADALGIDMDDLYASFPPNMFAYCNPGEVTCRVSDFPTLVIVWRGGVEEDRNYIPIPIGAAKYYDGDSHNIRNTVLRALTFAHGEPV